MKNLLAFIVGMSTFLPGFGQFGVSNMDFLINANNTTAPPFTGNYLTYEDIVPGLATSDVQLLNISMNTFGSYLSGGVYPVFYGKFRFTGPSDIGIDSGMALSTGWVPDINNIPQEPIPGCYSGIPWPAIYHSGGYNPGGWFINATYAPFRWEQYPDLLGLNNGDSIADANILEFDFVPSGSQIRLEYVFASEEYGQDPCTMPNDVMGIFLSGPGIAGVQNIALVPGTTVPVGVRTINSGTPLCNQEFNYAQYYVDNTGGQNVIFDGFTTVLTASAYVNPCDTYHLRIAMADGARHDADTIAQIDNFAPIMSYYDSGIFLKSGGFRSADSLWLETLGGTSLSSDYPYAVRGCLDGKIRIHSATAWPLDRELELVLAGDAVAGTDFQPFNTTVVIPANETFVDIDVLALSSGSGTKTLQAVLKSPYGSCSGLGDYLDTTTLFISDGYYVSAEPVDTTICSGCSVQLRVMGEDFLSYSWSPTAGLDNPNSKEPIASPTSNTQYTVTAIPPSGYPCSGSSDSVWVNIDPTGIDDMEVKGDLQVYPNPNQGTFTMVIESPKGFTELDYSLVDFLGRIIHKGSMKATERVFKQELNFPELSSGVYSLEVTMDGLKMVRKISVYK